MHRISLVVEYLSLVAEYLKRRLASTLTLNGSTAEDWTELSIEDFIIGVRQTGVNNGKTRARVSVAQRSDTMVPETYSLSLSLLFPHAHARTHACTQ